MSSPQFRFNPLTGKLDISAEGGGPVVNVTFTPDQGGSVTGSDFVITGQMAGSASPMTTLNEGGELVWENRTWQTPYVVDTHTTVGVRGTFSTIAEALDAAVLDGMTISNPRIIQLRNASYVEDLVIPGGACFNGALPVSDPSNLNVQVTITGNHTVDNIGMIYSNGVSWVTDTGTMFTSGDTTFIFVASNSAFVNTSSGRFVDSSAAGQTALLFDNCEIIANAYLSEQFLLGENVDSHFISCQLGGASFDVTGGVIRFYQCIQAGEIDLHNAAIVADNSSFFAAIHDNIITDGLLSSSAVCNCKFASNGGSLYAIGGAGADAVKVINCSISPQSVGPKDFVNPSVQSPLCISQMGNVINSVVRTAVTYVAEGSEGYIGVTNTSAPRTISLRARCKNQAVYVVDESGGAGTNNITVNVVGGATINGAASVAIDDNYAGWLFYCVDGVNFVVIASSAIPIPLPISVANGGTGSTGITGIVAGSGTAYAGRTLQSGGNLLIANGNGASADPTLTVTGGGYIWNSVTGASQTVAANNAYFANNAGARIDFNLSTLAIGDSALIVGVAAGGWRLNNNGSSRQVRIGNVASTAGTGYIESTNQYDCVEVVAFSATLMLVRNSMGNINVV